MKIGKVELSDVAHIDMGFAFKSEEFSSDIADVKLIRGDNIAQGITRWDRTEHWPISYIVDEKYNLRIGDLVLAMDRPWVGAGLKYAKIRADDLPAYLVQRVARIRAKENINQDYITCIVGGRPFTDYVLSVQTGTSIPHISGRQIGAFEFPIHSPQDQQAIAEVLGALDDKIAANTKFADTADCYLAAQFSAYLDSGFDEVLLGEVATVNAGTVKPTPGGLLRYIDIASVGVGSHDFPEPIPWDDAPSRARRKVSKGDTIWSTVRPNRRSHSLNLSSNPLLVGSTGLAVLSPSKVGFAYLYEVTKRPEFTAYLENVAEGSAYPAVRANRFTGATIPLLSQSDRNEFEGLAAPLRENIHSLTVESRTLAATRDALLPQLMSGKLRVKDAEELVAAAL